MRRKLIAANWKMNKTIAEAESFAAGLKSGLSRAGDCDLLLFPPFLCLPAVVAAVEGSRVGVGAQDLFWEPSGAFTGEVSAAMIADAGAQWVLVGHSERRHVLGEDNATVARKLDAALASGLCPILCVGETIEEREAGRAGDVVREQLETALSGKAAGDLDRLVVAYEPVWAIGTGKTASPDDAEEMHRLVRAWVGGAIGEGAAESLRIQYGGSVKPSNAASLLGREDIDGALVGGASLELESFLGIAAAV